MGLSRFGRAALCVTSTILFLGLLASTDAAQASTSWNVSSLPGVSAGPPSGSQGLGPVSCVSASFCVSVGQDTPTSAFLNEGLAGITRPFVEVWSDNSWSATNLPLPPGGSAVEMSSVSCISVDFCMAVGEYQRPSGGAQPLAETFSSGTWTATSLPLPERAYPNTLSVEPELGGVSCVSATSCVAVGYYQVQEGVNRGICCFASYPMAEVFSGTTWKVSTLPTPLGFGGFMSGISCTLAGTKQTCVAIGTGFLSSSDTGWGPISETLTGRSWTAARLPLPADNASGPDGGYGTGAFPWTISCGATGSCVALGAYVTVDSEGGLVAEQLSAGAWTAVPVPIPAGGSFPFPSSYVLMTNVSCPAVDSCVATSTDQASDGSQQAFSDTLSSRGWGSTSMLPVPAGDSVPIPLGISCISVGSCVAIGVAADNASSTEVPISETLQTGMWVAAPMSLPAPSPMGTLLGISCPSSTFCVAVGYYESESSSSPGGVARIPLAEVLSGSTWTAVPLPLPQDAVPSTDTNPLLQGVSCASPQFCVAVGYYPNGENQERPLAEMYSGGTWTAKRLPLAGSGLEGTLASVSCLSDTSCVAVGAPDDEAFGLVETFSGSTWTETRVPRPSGVADEWLAGVSCVSVGSCVAVGTYWISTSAVRRSRPLAVSLSGGVWQPQELPAPADVSAKTEFNIPTMRSVVCQSMTSCVAAGFYPVSSFKTKPLIESLSGHSWSPLSPDVLGSPEWTLLFGISCSSANACVAVGSSEGNPLVTTLNGGTWTSTFPVPPVGADTGGSLLAVSCLPTGQCVAAGSNLGASGVYPSVATGAT
jgi:hypothetical protein